MGKDYRIQTLAEESGKDRLVIVVTLPDGDTAIKFQRAAMEIDDYLENTRSIIVALAEAGNGEGVPPEMRAVTVLPTKDVTLVGVIHGPERNQIPDGLEEATKTNWFGTVVGILADYGLTEASEETVN